MRLASVRAVVFDLGETLVSEHRLWAGWAERLEMPVHVLYAALGATIERGEHHRQVFELLRPGFDPAVFDAFDVLELGDFYPDALPVLRNLRQRGFLLGIAGNQSTRMQQQICLLNPGVDLVASAESWGVEKPSPAFFRRIAQELDLPAEHILYVGDRVDNHVLPAAETGMVTAFLRRGPWGVIHARRPEVSHADLEIENLVQLAEALPSEPGKMGRSRKVQGKPNGGTGKGPLRGGRC